MLYWCGFAVARWCSKAGVYHLPRVKIAGRSQSLGLMAVNEEVRGRLTPRSKERGSVEAAVRSFQSAVLLRRSRRWQTHGGVEVLRKGSVS